MKQLTIRDIIDLVTTDLDQGELRIERIFQWHVERLKVIVQWILGATATLIIGVLIAFFRAELAAPAWQWLLAIVSAVLTGSYGAYRLRELRWVGQQYIAALRLYARLRHIRRFLRTMQGAAP